MVHVWAQNHIFLDIRGDAQTCRNMTLPKLVSHNCMQYCVEVLGRWEEMF